MISKELILEHDDEVKFDNENENFGLYEDNILVETYKTGC